MTGIARVCRLPTSAHTYLATVLLMGLAAALLLRYLIGGPQLAVSQPAGLSFAVALLLISLAAGIRLRLARRIFLVGLLGGLFLCLPAFLTHMAGHDFGQASAGYPTWAAAVAIIAVAEEAFFRGALYDAFYKLGQTKAAIIMPAIAFAAIHLPAYGWRAFPLDLSVGLWLGVLRLYSGSFAAPAIAHTIADWAGWWV